MVLARPETEVLVTCHLVEILMLTMSGISFISFPLFLVLLELASPLESRGEERILLAKPSNRSYQDNLLAYS